MTTYHIGGDVDSRITELAILGERDREPRHLRVPTAIPPLREALKAISGRKVFVIEEGSMADWLYRNLRPFVEEMIVCDPRRNKLISQDGDKNNRIDGKKLAELSRAGLLRPVHHGVSQDRAALKQWVSLYYDRVRQAVREVNKIRARCRMWGTHPRRGALRNPKVRDPWLKKLDPSLGGQLRVLFACFDTVRQKVERCRQELARRAKPHAIIARWQKVPGIALIRAVTFLAYMDTPWRFGNRRKVWRYCGVGLQRYASGTDKWGREKAGTLRLAWSANKRLKAVVLGAAMTAINQGDNAIADYYRTAIRSGTPEGHARHTAARKLIDRMMAMWKTGSQYSPDLA
jgi:transposase